MTILDNLDPVALALELGLDLTSVKKVEYERHNPSRVPIEIVD